MIALFYDYVPDYLQRREEFRAQHLELANAAKQRGELIYGGAFTDPPDGALLVWNTDDRSTVEKFVAVDPYVTNGLVTAWRIRSWSVVVGGH
jgi:uncharacterized protein YciI